MRTQARGRLGGASGVSGRARAPSAVLGTGGLHAPYCVRRYHPMPTGKWRRTGLGGAAVGRAHAAEGAPITVAAVPIRSWVAERLLPSAMSASAVAGRRACRPRPPRTRGAPLGGPAARCGHEAEARWGARGAARTGRRRRERDRRPGRHAAATASGSGERRGPERGLACCWWPPRTRPAAGHAGPGWADRAYWAGQALIVVPAAVRLLGRGPLTAVRPSPWSSC